MVQKSVGTDSVKRLGSREAQTHLDKLFEKFDKPRPVHLISTGGTIEFQWNRKKDCMAIGSESVLPPYIQSLKPYTTFDFTTVCLKDGREITQKDRRNIRDTVLASSHERILIAHGCFTAPDTAEYLLDELPANHGKTVVVFGSKDPFAELLSEGPFNFGFATACSEILEPGVYVSMEGRIFRAGEVSVNSTRAFEEGAITADEAQQRLDSIFGKLNKPETLHVVRTGGTIESRWEPTLDTAVTDVNPWLQIYLERIGLQLKLQFTTACLKDSRDITYRDRKQIVEAITSSQAKKVIVPHGTYTMADTGQFINERLPEDHDKSVVLFGAMIPLNGFVPSDAPFNCGFATGAALVLKAGVYVAMNTRLFNAEDVEKNRSEGRFEEAENQ
ncbi:asparaginase [Candidatus Micrarchaeota archaeon]|nr:asparaginase [Candidatus Micrarchaeota archaeon]